MEVEPVRVPEDVVDLSSVSNLSSLHKQEYPMKYVGIDLHKKTISVCVVDKGRIVLERKKFLCVDVKGISAWFGGLGEFQFVVEATACYEWLARLLEPLASGWQLANPGKMRLIAESTKKTDKHDAQVLAEFLALGMIPQSYRPGVRQREHRKLVRYRTQCQQRVSRLKCQIRYLAASYNGDHRQLFQVECLEELRARPDLTAGDRFILQERLRDYEEALERVRTAKAELRRFAGTGLAPAKRESDGKGKDLPITKQGSRLLRWAMVEAAWSAVANSARWRGVYEALKRRRQSKRAIIAVARRLLTVLVSMLRSGTTYRASLAELREREAKAALRAHKKRTAKTPTAKGKRGVANEASMV